MNNLLEQLEQQYKESATLHSSLMAKFLEPNYEENFEDTITRTYEEGYSDALQYVIGLLLESEGN